jgi:hypothetical protein
MELQTYRNLATLLDNIEQGNFSTIAERAASRLDALLATITHLEAVARGRQKQASIAQRRECREFFATAKEARKRLKQAAVLYNTSIKEIDDNGGNYEEICIAFLKSTTEFHLEMCKITDEISNARNRYLQDTDKKPHDTGDRLRAVEALFEKTFNVPAAPALPDAVSVLEYVAHTGEEMDILERSASDGWKGTHWRNEEQRGARVYERKGAKHRVELLRRMEGEYEVSFDLLERLTRVQDSDFALTTLYIVSALAPPAPLPHDRAAVGWIDLNDVMAKIGWYPSKRSSAVCDTLRNQVWGYIIYASCALVMGERSVDYIDPHSGKALPTAVDSSIWKIMSEQRPLQDSLFDEAKPAPVRVQIVISKQWEPLLTDARLAQYLPLAELLGSIPSGQVAGDWARSIGLALARLWRMRPRETLIGGVKPTRRELLTHYTPKKKTIEELLDSDNPMRAVKYWAKALDMLVKKGLIQSSGEAARSLGEMLKNYGRQDWDTLWLDEKVIITPGPKWMPMVEERAQALPPLKPKVLTRKKVAKGR